MSQVAEPQRTQECEIRMGTIEERTGLKDLGTTGARWLVLVPGAGIEPARTLPGPRDFKSGVKHPHLTLTDKKALYSLGSPPWYSAFLLLAVCWFGYNIGYSRRRSPCA